MYIKRAIEETILRISKTFPVLLVTGPRQVGKTTLLKHLAGETRTYVTLDDPDVRMVAVNDPALFMQRYNPPIIIDEIQYAPQLLPYIKMHVDNSKKRGDFWLTGSQAFHMMKNVSESLAGRIGIVNLLGLSGSEINKAVSEPFTTDSKRLLERLKNTEKFGLTELYSKIYQGFFPVLYHKNPPDLAEYYRAYINTYLQRDIKDLSQVGDEMSFLNFMISIAARTAKPVIYEEIARDVGISQPTAKKWLSVMISSGLVALLQPYYSNVLKRAVKMPLLHFLDTGLCAYLLKWGNPETLERSAMSGAFFESWVFSEIYKSYINAGREAPLYYYRDKEKREIDLIIYENGTLFPIEIKKAASVGKETIKHFKIINKPTEQETQTGSGAVICMANDLLPIDNNNWIVPAWLI